MKKLALPLSLLALGALGLVACGGDDDEDTTAEAQVSAGSTAETRFPAETTTEAKVSPDISLVPAKHSPELVRAQKPAFDPSTDRLLGYIGDLSDRFQSER